MSSGTELWQAYDTRGLPLATAGITKLQARAGVLHGAAHVWLWREVDDGIEVLMQQRAQDKPTWPGFFDISAAGHIDFGETPLKAAVRETKEELGVDIAETDDIRLLFVNRQYIVDETSGYIENEFQWVYGLKYTFKSDFTLADGEVDGLVWHKLRDLHDIMEGHVDGVRIVPQGKVYFDSLIKELDRWHTE